MISLRPSRLGREAARNARQVFAGRPGPRRQSSRRSLKDHTGSQNLNATRTARAGNLHVSVTARILFRDKTILSRKVYEGFLGQGLLGDAAGSEQRRPAAGRRPVPDTGRTPFFRLTPSLAFGPRRLRNTYQFLPSSWQHPVQVVSSVGGDLQGSESARRVWMDAASVSASNRFEPQWQPCPSATGPGKNLARRPPG